MMPAFDSLSLDECHLNPTRIDIWQYPLGSSISNARALLSPEEQQRADRFHFERHQRRFTSAHAILRLILCQYIQCSPDTLHFTTGPFGKPQLNTPLHLQFNLSHSGEWALLAIGQQHELGIDLEFFSERPYVAIGDQLFSKAENHVLSMTTPALQPLVFFNIWSQKEAFIKACGLGLSYPTQRFDVPILSPNTDVIPDTLHHRTWSIRAFMPKISCCAAVCHDPNIRSIRFKTLNSTDIERLISKTQGPS